MYFQKKSNKGINKSQIRLLGGEKRRRRGEPLDGWFWVPPNNLTSQSDLTHLTLYPLTLTLALSSGYEV